MPGNAAKKLLLATHMVPQVPGRGVVETILGNGHAREEEFLQQHFKQCEGGVAFALPILEGSSKRIKHVAKGLTDLLYHEGVIQTDRVTAVRGIMPAAMDGAPESERYSKIAELNKTAEAIQAAAKSSYGATLHIDEDPLHIPPGVTRRTPSPFFRTIYSSMCLMEELPEVQRSDNVPGIIGVADQGCLRPVLPPFVSNALYEGGAATLYEVGTTFPQNHWKALLPKL